jgi:hypothetical protein
MADAVAAAHTAGVIHRDMEPSKEHNLAFTGSYQCAVERMQTDLRQAHSGSDVMVWTLSGDELDGRLG